MKVLILTEGGPNIGFGHICRCLALCQAFEERGITPEFLINGDHTVNAVLDSRDYRLFDWVNKKNELHKALLGVDTVVIDSYIADPYFYRGISERVRTCVYIDDNIRIDYPDGVLINGNIYAEGLDYLKKSGIVHLLGRRYSLLRKEFSKVPGRAISESVREIMVTLGGDDARGLTSIVLRLLTKNYPDLKKKVVLGKAFSNYDEIEKSMDERTELIYSPDAAVMKKLMLGADIAISSGGQTISELACLGVPTIGFSVADNQVANVNAWAGLGFLDPVPQEKDFDFSSFLLASLQRLRPFPARKARSLIGRKLIDGTGALNAIDKVLKHIRKAN